MHVDARNDEDLRHSASAWASGNPLSTILGGIDETHRTVVKTNATDVHMLHVKKVVICMRHKWRTFVHSYWEFFAK